MVSVQRPRNVAPVENALLVGDEGKNLLRLLPDQLRVPPRRLGVQPGAANLHPSPLHLGRMDAHMLGRLDLEPPLPVRPMVDPDIEPGPRQPLIGDLLPRLPNVPELNVGRGQTVGDQPLVLPLDIGLVAQAFGGDLARRHHHMGVVVANVARLMRSVDREIHRRPIPVRQVPGEGPRRLEPLVLRQLVRQRDLEFARDPRVLPLFGKLGRVPERRTVQGPFRAHPLRQDDLGMLDPVAPREVMRDPVAFVGQAFAGAIGRRGDGAPPARPRNRLHAAMIDRQAGRPFAGRPLPDRPSGSAP